MRLRTTFAAGIASAILLTGCAGGPVQEPGIQPVTPLDAQSITAPSQAASDAAGAANQTIDQQQDALEQLGGTE